MIIYESKDPNELKWGKTNMTILELFEKYGQQYMVSPLHSVAGDEKCHQIIQEVEALVRKETIEDILQLQVFWRTKRKNMEMIEEWRVDVDDIKEYAQSKGITL